MTNQPERLSSRRYARRDATNAPAWLRSTSSSIPSSQELDPCRARDPRPDLAHQVLRERTVVGIARICVGRGRIEPMTRLHVHQTAADSGVDFEHAIERDLTAERRHRIDRALVVGERTVADTRQDDHTVFAARDEAPQRGREPRVRQHGRLDVGAVAKVEHVAREHDDPGAAAFLDRLRHRAAHLPRDVRRGVGESEVAEDQGPAAPLDADRQFVGGDPPPTRQLHELAVRFGRGRLIWRIGHRGDRNPCSVLFEPRLITSAEGGGA